jgi:hypothetical protein
MKTVRTTVRTSLLLAIAMATSMSTLGHETIPSGWCLAPGSQPQIAQTFSFTQPQMIALAQQVEQSLGPEGLIAAGLAPREADGRCGIVDRWLMANYIAQHYCTMQTGNATVIANFTGPSSFLSANHHGSYNYGGGLHGACAVCVSKIDE